MIEPNDNATDATNNLTGISLNIITIPYTTLKSGDLVLFTCCFSRQIYFKDLFRFHQIATCTLEWHPRL